MPRIDIYQDRLGNQYKVDTLITIGKFKTLKTYPTSSFNYILDTPMWNRYSRRLTPKDVLADKVKYHKHWDRIAKANLNHPILLTEDGHRLIDGAHRITKGLITNQKHIKAHLINDKDLKKAMI